MNKYIYLISILIFMILPWQQLRACSCIPPPPPAEEFENSDAVFMARVTSFKPSGQSDMVAKFRLLILWKGNKVDKIFTGLNSAACGFHFVAGETYIIYAYKNPNGQLRTSICSRTASLERAREDWIFLEQKDALNSGCCGSVSGGDALMAGGVLLLLFLRRKKTCQFD